MGQKVNPKGFRLINNSNYLSNWYSHKCKYLNLIKEDEFLRKNIDLSFKNFLTISDIKITRSNNINIKNNSVFINISFLHPTEKEMKSYLSKNYANLFFKKNISYLKLFNNNLLELFSFLLKAKIKCLIKKLEFNSTNKIFIETYFIENICENASLISKYVAKELEKRISFRKIMVDIISRIESSNNKGIKIQISGRLNGAEMARTEWKKYGKIPLHTLDANIDYFQENAKTIYGIIGVKVWLFV
jgi:small subunit ribosomal protein S3